MVRPDKPLAMRPPALDDDPAERVRRDGEAERAIGRGLAEDLATYFRDFADPNPCVLQSLVWSLVGIGPSNQTLRFRTRNGRRSKKRERPPIIDEAAAIEALAVGDEQALASYLNHERLSDRVRLLLSDALGANGATKYRLHFKRIRRGYPDTPLRTELKKAFLGHAALDLRESRRISWRKVLDELKDQGLIGEDEAGLKDAVRFVRNRTKKPTQ